MMTNIKSVLFTDESRASPNDTDGLIKGWVFNDDNYTMGIRRQQSGLVIIIRGGMIGNELTSLFREPEELNCLLLAQLHEEDHLLAWSCSCMILVSEENSLHIRYHAFSRPFHAKIFVPRCQRRYFNQTFYRSHHLNGIIACCLFFIWQPSFVKNYSACCSRHSVHVFFQSIHITH